MRLGGWTDSFRPSPLWMWWMFDSLYCVGYSTDVYFWTLSGNVIQFQTHILVNSCPNLFKSTRPPWFYMIPYDSIFWWGGPGKASCRFNCHIRTKLPLVNSPFKNAVNLHVGGAEIESLLHNFRCCRPLVLYFHGNAETVDTYKDPDVFHPLEVSKVSVLATWLLIREKLEHSEGFELLICRRRFNEIEDRQLYRVLFNQYVT